MATELDIADLPGLLLRREGAFAGAKYPPEWCFWLYVAEKEGSETVLPLAEACACFFLENYTGLDKYPRGYREAVAAYQAKWWRSVPKPKETEVGVWELFSLMQELENAAAWMDPDLAYKRMGRSRLTVAMRSAGRNPRRIEFEVGRLRNVFRVSAYHPLTDRHYWPEWFFGDAGPGDTRIWALSEMEAKIATVFDFYTRFLPVFASCTRARPPTPYDQVQSE
jgi:hypothetical protein